jgi:hypothetical protein
LSHPLDRWWIPIIGNAGIRGHFGSKKSSCIPLSYGIEVVSEGKRERPGRPPKNGRVAKKKVAPPAGVVKIET